MRERYKRKQLSSVLGILVIIGLLALVFLIHGVVTVINSALNFSFMAFIEFAIILFLGIVIVRKWLTEYEYAVIDDEFFADRYIGNRSRRIFSAGLKNVLYIGKEKPQDSKRRKIRLTFRTGKKDRTYMLLIIDDEKRCLVFSPSDKMTELIKTRIL